MPKIRREQYAPMNIHYQLYPFEYYLKTQSALGIKTIEIWAGNPHFYMDSEYYQDNVADLRKVIEQEYGMKVGAFTPESASYQFQIAAWNDETWKKSIRYYINGIKCASGFGASVSQIACAGGAWNRDKRYAFDRAVEALRMLAPVASDYGVTLAVETLCPEESCVITSLPELKDVLEAVGHPNVKAAVDTCAMGVAGETLEQWFSVFGDDIRHMHFVDGRPYGRLVWGEGNHPLDDFLQVLNDHHYEGYLGQKLTEIDYRFKPDPYDIKNIDAFKPYFCD